MADVAKTCDEFGAYLQKVRNQRGFSRKQLANAVGKSDEYIAGWERYPRPINRQILHKVCDALELGEAERQQLFHLADEREGLSAPRERWAWMGRMLLNLSQTLEGVPHELPPEFRPNDWLAFGDAASWLLAASAASDFSMSRLGWPDWFRRQKIVDVSDRDHAEQEPIPAEILEDELPDLDQVRDLNRQSIQRIGLAMAAVYRRWLFADLDRTRAVAGRLREWVVSPDPNGGLIVTFKYRDAAFAEEYNVPGVNVMTAESVRRRELASHLWVWCNARKIQDEASEFPIPQEPVDGLTFLAFRSAQSFLVAHSEGNAASFWETAGISPSQLRQSIEDALFVLRSKVWDPPNRVSMALWIAGQVVLPEGIRKTLEKRPFETEALLYDPVFDKAYDVMVDTLESAAKQLDRESRRAGATHDEPPKKQEPKSRAASRKRTKSRKKKKR